ncbi:hypothetical protein CWATWH0402_550 [Crocosphaera watsonii WH 0402]|uniref:Uncharacterized protein n=1 Tax=Crocosphaera watsonii WH 0402 TaxID=1284629 RepID=T2JJA1_CROWT|nr:hypothetical protein [Crocosphaera watsonii]CCQ65330.1 hypothetical protein CWATWH0402_550 [Crocosphaera watsonii WH 0402]
MCQKKEAAIALTKDNGYYLIALPSYSDVFTSINYSLGNVGQQTYTLMKKIITLPLFSIRA